MSNPADIAVANGISVMPSPNGRHLVLRLHGDGHVIHALILMEPECASKIGGKIAEYLPACFQAHALGGLN